MKQVRMGRSDICVPAIGQGTWQMGVDQSSFAQEVEALRTGIELGLTLIDTAEMYADGGAERVVAEAIKDCRDDCFIVTKVWPTNGSYDGVLQAASRSLKRLNVDVIDLYLLHWPSATYPVSETMRAMKKLQDDGAIRLIGVSNFDVELMKEAEDALGEGVLACNQLGFHLRDRVIERSILPYCQQHHITTMAYSPLGAGNFPSPGTKEREVLNDIGRKYDATAFQVALSWVISHDNVVAIPKASSLPNVKSNAAALRLELSEDDRRLIDEHFPKPQRDFQVTRY